MTSDSSPQIHRLPIFDAQHNLKEDYALLQITSTPGKIWPLHIEATEGESSYHAKISRPEIAALREKKNQKSKEEWESLVVKCLLRQPDDVSDTAEIEIFATLAPEELTIVIRKKIGEVKQRLGEIPIRLDEEHEVDVLGWCHHAVVRGDTLALEQQSLQAKFSDQQNTISDLNKRLEELIVAKKEHENALMAKFCELLNNKKLKIRDQQRLLATVKVDDAQAAQVRESRQEKSTKVPAKSRKGKRKAAAFTDDEEVEDDEEAFGAGNAVKAEVDGEPDSEEEEARKTDEGSNAGDETTDDEIEEKGLTAKSQSTLPQQADSGSRIPIQDVSMDDLPPVRELPFGRKEKPKQSAESIQPKNAQEHVAVRPQDDDDDETTDDDEL